MYEVSDVALNAYYADVFEASYGYDPMEGPYEDEDEEEED